MATSAAGRRIPGSVRVSRRKFAFALSPGRAPGLSPERARVFFHGGRMAGDQARGGPFFAGSVAIMIPASMTTPPKKK